MTRAKNLTTANIEKIVNILDGWTGRLTWDLLIDDIAKRTFARYTRQALHKHARIQDAFNLRKVALSSERQPARKKATTPEVQILLDKIDRLTAENERLDSENSRLLEQFVRWAHNAYPRGCDLTILNMPLPKVNRQQTPLKAVKSERKY